LVVIRQHDVVGAGPASELQESADLSRLLRTRDVERAGETCLKQTEEEPLPIARNGQNLNHAAAHRGRRRGVERGTVADLGGRAVPRVDQVYEAVEHSGGVAAAAIVAWDQFYVHCADAREPRDVVGDCDGTCYFSVPVIPDSDRAAKLRRSGGIDRK